MSDVGRALAFASRLYGQRAGTAYAGYVKRDPLALLRLRSWRSQPAPARPRAPLRRGRKHR